MRAFPTSRLLLASAIFCLALGALACPRIAAGEAQYAQEQSATGGSPLPQNSPASSANPEPQPMMDAAKSLVAAGKLDEAESTLRKFLAAHPDSAPGHFLLGHVLFDELHQTYAAKEETEGQSFRYNGDVGKSLADLRDAKARESLAEFSAGAKYASPAADDLKTVGLDYVLLRDNASAEKWLALGLQMEPKDPRGWYLLGRTRYSQDEFAPAIEAFEQCLKLDPKNVLAESNVGLSFQGLNQNDEAVQAYQTAISWEAQSQSKSPDPYIFLSRLYLNRNQPEKAAPFLEEAVKTWPQVSVVREQLGKAYFLLHRLPEARTQLEVAASLAPDAANVHFLLGQVYRGLGMMDKAKIEFQRTEELNGTHASRNSPS